MISKKDFNELKIGDLIEVIWLDTNTPIKDGWTPAKKYIGSNTKMKIHSVSYFFGIKEGQLNIAADKMIDKKYDPLINRRMSIPLGCIEKVRKI